MSPAALIRLMHRPKLAPRLKLGPEDVFCIEFADRLRAWTIEGRLDAVWTHVGNEVAGGAKNAQIRYAIARALGMITGATDYMFLWANGSGVLEAKAGRNSLTASQNDFAAWCTARGIRHRVIRSADDGETALKEWGILRP